MDSKLYNEIGKAVKIANKRGGTLTEKNLLYVAKVAADVAKSTGANIDELITEGVIEMMKFENKYDSSQNDNFVKASAKRLRGVMTNFVNRQQSLVHIPVNLMPGFKKGQKMSDDVKFKYDHIDSFDYDTLGAVDDNLLSTDQDSILQSGLDNLDINGRIAIEMKLRMGKYSEMIPSKDDPEKMIYKYKNNMQSIAEELEVPLSKANKIYKEAFAKLSKYCQAASNG